MNLGATLIQATNLVLLIANTGADIRKFIVWRTDGNSPVEVLSKLEISRIAVEDSAKVFEHPIESGAVIVDYEVFEPKSVTIQAYISNDDASTLKELEYLYLSGAELRIRAGNKIIDKVVINSKPYEITGSVFDKTLYSINFREAQEVSPVYTNLPKAQNASNTSRVNSGVKQAKPTPAKRSWLKSAISGGRT